MLCLLFEYENNISRYRFWKVPTKDVHLAEHLTRPSLKMVSQDKDNVASNRVKNHFVWVRLVIAETGRCQYKCFKKSMSIQTGVPTKCNFYKKYLFFSYRKVDWYQRKDEKVINDIFKISILWIYDTRTSQITRSFIRWNIRAIMFTLVAWN